MHSVAICKIATGSFMCCTS